MGGTPFAGQRPIETPFGTVYSTNLTPDPATGLGNWTKDDFWQALHHGQAKDGRLLSPVFPYPSYTRVTREDADALFAHLQSLPPVNQANRAAQMRWPFGTQLALRAWRALFFNAQTFQPDTALSADWNRGAYLVNGLGHCGECHTPRNALGGLDRTRWLAGAPNPSGEGRIPDITPGRLQWTEAGIAEYLKSGFTPDFDTAGGEMAEVVRNTARLTDADRAAIAAYLKIVPASGG